MKKYNRGYTTGVYDMFHIGHLNILRKAKELCDYLIVGVTTDKLCYERKNKYPIIPEEDRKAIVESIRYVDEVVLQEDMDKVRFVRDNNIDVVFVGSDWKGTDAWNNYERLFKDIGCDVVYFEHTDKISSTILRDKIKNGADENFRGNLMHA